jgi:release factor glutamine methyltransferase
MPRAADALLARPATIAETRRAVAARLRVAGFDSPDLDARVLLGHALGLDHAALAAAGPRDLIAHEEKTIGALVDRRLSGEPVARIVGCKEFWSLPLQVNAATLVPRPETETIVEAALAAIDAHGPRSRALRIADLGTGTGAILLALLSELPNAFGVGTDINPQALTTAQGNAHRLALTQASFAACDIAAALRGPFDLIVSNPPYILSADIVALDVEVRNFDPHQALDGGADGLDYYRAIAVAAPALLTPGGALVVELGVGQAEPVAALFAAAGLAPSLLRNDLSGRPRALVALKAA